MTPALGKNDITNLQNVKGCLAIRVFNGSYMIEMLQTCPTGHIPHTEQ